MAKLSVIVPIYNVERFLPNCVESLLGQTHTDIEFILVNDGSPDRCGEIADRYAASDARIRVIHQSNSGVSAARNAGLDAATGDYIGFVDPDDWVAPEMYSEMLHALEQTGADMAACGYDYYDEECNIDRSRLYKEAPDEILSRFDLFSRLSDMPPTIRHVTWNKLFPRKVIEGLRYDGSLHSSEDLQFLMDALRNVHQAVFIHKPFYKNTVREGSATHGGLKVQSLRDSFRVHHRMYADTVREFPNLRNHAQAMLLDVCTLKYNEARRKARYPNLAEAKCLADMRHYLRRMAVKSLFNNQIYWKTRLYYLSLWIRK